VELHIEVTEGGNPLARNTISICNSTRSRSGGRPFEASGARAHTDRTFERRECRSPRLSLWRRCVARIGRFAGLVAGAGLAASLVAGLAGCSDEAEDLVIPLTYLAAGRVVDPTTDPITGIAGARVTDDTDPEVRAVTTDDDGNFVLQGLSPGTHRLRVELAGRVTTISYDIPVQKNVIDALVPIFTAAQIDSVLLARGAPAWDREAGIFGLFALRSNGLPIGDATVTFAPPPGGTLVQTGEGKDPIVLVNGAPGDIEFSITRAGYVWDDPYRTSLRPGVLAFAAPRARPNFVGYAFANNAGGAAVSGALVTLESGPDAGRSTTTNFLGQFTFVALAPGTGRARFEATGFLPGLTWPQPFDQDTTLVQILLEPDTLAAWSALEGGPPLDPARGAMVVDARAAMGGDLALGARIVIHAGPGGTGDAAIVLSAAHPAIHMNLNPGFHRVSVTAPGYLESVEIDSVEVRAGEVTYTRIDLEVPAAARHASRAASRRAAAFGFQR
jgi:hypothetical protein